MVHTFFERGNLFFPFTKTQEHENKNKVGKPRSEGAENPKQIQESKAQE